MLAHDMPIAPGFQDPVHDSQRTFTIIMDAMARPGRVKKPVGLPTAPTPLFAPTAAVLLTLCDHDTDVWLDPEIVSTQQTPRWLTFHTGAPLTDDVKSADFIVIKDGSKTIDLHDAAMGTPEYPDRSATFVIQVDSLDDKAGWALIGPGIQDRHLLDVQGLAAEFTDQWRANNALFPLGIDVILCAPDAIACLPRTTQIEGA